MRRTACSGLNPARLPGLPIRDYLPSLINVPGLDSNRQVFRTAMQCRGRRADGEVFQADVWFSTYVTSAGPRLAAMVLDTSEDLRTHEESSFHQMLASSRIMVAAISHEVRNVCGAIALVHENLSRSGKLKENKDFETLGTLVLALERIAAMDLRQTASHAAGVEVQPLLDELRIVIESSLRDSGVASRWEIEEDLPAVWADRQSLMQVFLNLTKNSERAMEEQERKELTVSARREALGVAIRFRDTGERRGPPGAAFPPLPGRCPVDRAGPLSVARLHAQFQGRSALRTGEPGARLSWWSCHPLCERARMTAMSSEIQILLIDDHSLFRESLSRLLQTESDFQIVATCASASEALALPQLKEIDVVLLDYDLGHEQGTHVSRSGARCWFRRPHFDGDGRHERCGDAARAGERLLRSLSEAQSPEPPGRGHPQGLCRRGLARPGGDPFHHRRGHRQLRLRPAGRRA